MNDTIDYEKLKLFYIGKEETSQNIYKTVEIKGYYE